MPGWNYRREHLRLSQRSHYVITNGGDQPNVVPRNASVWYYFREIDYPHIKELWDIGNKMAEGAALMTNTKWTSRILGTAWPRHFNKTTAETMYENIKRVGLPTWSEADQTLARALQKELGNADAARAGDEDRRARSAGACRRQPRRRLRRHRRHLVEHADGDAALSRRTFPGCPATTGPAPLPWRRRSRTRAWSPGAKVQAMTILDLVMKPELVKQAWDYFTNVQTKDQKYVPFIAKDTPPPTWLNKAILDKYRPEMKKYYYDPSKYPTYLDQLGIKYPTVRTGATSQQ